MSYHDTSDLSGYEPLFSQSERRRFQRVQLDLTGRYMLASQSEHPCRTVDISPGGMQLIGAAQPVEGEKIVVYIDALGRFVGHAVRLHSDGFSMTIVASARKRDMLADKLTWFANRVALDIADARRHDRFEPFQKLAILRLENGREHIVKLRDLSASGVSVEAAPVPAIGERVAVGKLYVTVVRHFDGGFAAQFETPFAAGVIDETTRL